MANWISEAKVRAIIAKLEVDISDWSSTELNAVIALQQAIFQKYTGRSIAQTSRTDRVDGSGLASLVAPDRPIISITQVSILSYDLGTYAESDLYVEKKKGIIWLETVRVQNYNVVWPKGQRNIQIEAVYGYATIPDEILETLALASAAQVLIMEPSRKDGESVTPGLQSFKIGNYSENYGASGAFSSTIERWDKLIKQVADLHRLVRIL